MNISPKERNRIKTLHESYANRNGSLVLLEGESINPKVVKQKTKIQTNVGKKVEKILREDLIELTTNAENKMLDFMVRQLLPLDNLITQSTNLIPLYTKLITSSYFDCIKNHTNSEKSVNHFLENVFKMAEREINKMGYATKKLIISQLKENGKEIDDLELEVPPMKMKKLLKSLFYAFFIGPYLNYIVEVKNLNVGGTHCISKVVEGSDTGRRIISNKLEELLPKLNQLIIKKLKS